MSITFLAGPISAITDRAAESSSDQRIYQHAVLSGDPTNPTRDLDAFRQPTDSGGGKDALARKSARSADGEDVVTTERVPLPASATAEPTGAHR